MRIRSVLNYGAAPAALALAMVSTPAMAQEAPADEEIVDEDEDDNVIRVTGTRIQLPNL